MRIYQTIPDNFKTWTKYSELCFFIETNNDVTICVDNMVYRDRYKILKYSITCVNKIYSGD